MEGVHLGDQPISQLTSFPSKRWPQWAWGGPRGRSTGCVSAGSSLLALWGCLWPRSGVCDSLALHPGRCGRCAGTEGRVARLRRAHLWEPMSWAAPGTVPLGQAHSLGAQQERARLQRRRRRFDPWVRKTPWRGGWQPAPVFLPGNPLDRGAWRAAVHGATKRWTRPRDRTTLTPS